MFKAEVIHDSVNPYNGIRLITSELTYPRFIHSEFMTHRVFSRNAASSRAIKTSKMIEMVEQNPAMPVFWGKNRPGMSASKEIDDIPAAVALWLEGRNNAVETARKMLALNMHKQIVNRILEPWKWITTIVTATDYSNFFSLRNHEDAQPEIHHLAKLWDRAIKESSPVRRLWHIPYIQSDELELPLETRLKISTARCARVSYLTHDGIKSIEKDLELYDRLRTGSGHGHWSPFEHQAEASALNETRWCPKAKFWFNEPMRFGNLRGWTQWRKMHAGECQ